MHSKMDRSDALGLLALALVDKPYEDVLEQALQLITVHLAGSPAGGPRTNDHARSGPTSAPPDLPRSRGCWPASGGRR